MSTRFNTVFITLLVLYAPLTTSAWTGPTAAPPTNNTLAPVNIGTSDQVKNGGLSLNSLAVFGNTLLSGTTNYLNFGTVAGTSGYGLRNNSGSIEFKHNGGSWSALGASSWTTSGSNIYSANTGNVGVGTTSPFRKFSITGDMQITGNVYAVGYFHNSDRTLKTNIQTSQGLETVKELRGVTFDWKNNGAASAGVIAQEVERIMPSAVHTDETGIKSVEYTQLIAPLIEAIKEQQAEIEFLKKEISNLKYGL